MKFLLAFLTILILSSAVSFAHIPEIVTENRNYTTEPIIVEEPEISFAYYGKLQGSPHIYKIESEESFYLYVSLLVPYVGQEESSDVEFHIMKDGEKIVIMHDYQNWTQWYEEYGGDWYLQGPTYESEVEAGTYFVEVHSDTNSEDYSLAIGNIERFGPFEILKTIFVLPVMKALFWDSYFMITIYILAIIIAVLLVLLIRKKRRHKRKR